jgi:hypothetical protein
MTPTAYRDGANTAIHFSVGECSLGSILVAQSMQGLCAILLGDNPDLLVRDLQDRFPKATLVGGDAGFERLRADEVDVPAARRVIDAQGRPAPVRGFKQHRQDAVEFRFEFCDGIRFGHGVVPVRQAIVGYGSTQPPSTTRV